MSSPLNLSSQIMHCDVLAQPPSSQKPSSTSREPQQPHRAILLAIHDRNRHLGKLRRGQAHAGHGAAVRTTPQWPHLTLASKSGWTAQITHWLRSIPANKVGLGTFSIETPCFPHILPAVRQQSQNLIFINFCSKNQIHYLQNCHPELIFFIPSPF
jgi:hypothetical protein